MSDNDREGFLVGFTMNMTEEEKKEFYEDRRRMENELHSLFGQPVAPQYPKSPLEYMQDRSGTRAESMKNPLDISAVAPENRKPFDWMTPLNQMKQFGRKLKFLRREAYYYPSLHV